ncbi:MAG: CRISPR-associated protein Csx16 [Gammaproteobacteria bacterium]|nr:CRISPR-associated protein Csx16 [Gammaproteobacteria bacterium]
MKRLVSFVGTGSYRVTTYAWPGRGERQTEYVAEALAGLWQPDEIVLLATPDARASHGDVLTTRLSAIAPVPRWVVLPAGRNTAEQWQQFELLRQCLQSADAAPILFDITHGFRAQPFLAGAALAVMRAADHLPGELRIVYGEYHHAEPLSPIWDLTVFLRLMDWAQAISVFLRTGVAGPVVALAREERRNQSEQARDIGDRHLPGFGQLVGAIERFAADLATVRVAALVTGYEQEDARKPRAASSAKALFDAIEACRADVARCLPPLAIVLDRLADDVQPLSAARLFGAEGQRALQALARYYVELERYPEAAIVVREGYVNRHAPASEAVEVNSATFANHLRLLADERFRAEDPNAREIADARNDIEHGGFRRQPMSAAALTRRIRALTERFARPQQLSADLPVAASSRTIFVSRHPGAAEWAAQENIAVDVFVPHLDLESVHSGDTVIGTLPVHQVANLVARGVRYLHLVLDTPESIRGRELSAEQLRELGAGLHEFTARRVVTVVTD